MRVGKATEKSYVGESFFFKNQLPIAVRSTDASSDNLGAGLLNMA